MKVNYKNFNKNQEYNDAFGILGKKDVVSMHQHSHKCPGLDTEMLLGELLSSGTPWTNGPPHCLSPPIWPLPEAQWFLKRQFFSSAGSLPAIWSEVAATMELGQGTALYIPGT